MPAAWLAPSCVPQSVCDPRDTSLGMLRLVAACSAQKVHQCGEGVQTWLYPFIYHTRPRQNKPLLLPAPGSHWDSPPHIPQLCPSWQLLSPQKTQFAGQAEWPHVCLGVARDFCRTNNNNNKIKVALIAVPGINPDFAFKVHPPASTVSQLPAGSWICFWCPSGVWYLLCIYGTLC